MALFHHIVNYGALKIDTSDLNESLLPQIYVFEDGPWLISFSKTDCSGENV